MRFYFYPGHMPINLIFIILGGKDMFKNKNLVLKLISTLAMYYYCGWCYFGYQIL